MLEPPIINLITLQGKRGLTDSSVHREVDIESLVDSVIDEHMNNKPDSNSNNREYSPAFLALPFVTCHDIYFLSRILY